MGDPDAGARQGRDNQPEVLRLVAAQRLPTYALQRTLARCGRHALSLKAHCLKARRGPSK